MVFLPSLWAQSNRRKNNTKLGPAVNGCVWLHVYVCVYLCVCLCVCVCACACVCVCSRKVDDLNTSQKASLFLSAYIFKHVHCEVILWNTQSENSSKGRYVSVCVCVVLGHLPVTNQLLTHLDTHVHLNTCTWSSTADFCEVNYNLSVPKPSELLCYPPPTQSAVFEDEWRSTS